MTNRLSIYIFGDYDPHSSDGLLEFSSQNAHLLQAEFQFHFIRFSKTHQDGFYKESIEDGFIIHHFGSADVSELWLPKGFLKWLKAFRETRSLFHINHIYTYNNYIVARTLTENGMPYLVTPHDSYVYSDEFRQTKPVLKRLYRDIIVKLRDRYVLRNASLIHELTDRYIETIRKMTDAPVMVVPNQISDLRLPVPDFNLLKEQVCYVGRFDIVQKGIDIAIRAFGLLKLKHDARFVLVGPDMPGAKEKREALSLKSGLKPDSDILFPGRVSEEERNRILSESKIYIQLSRFEGFGLSVIQALCASKPVVVSSSIPISSIIEASGAGIIADTPEQAAQALQKIFELDPDSYRLMSQNARRCYEREFSPEVVKPKLLNLYRSAYTRDDHKSLIR